MLGDKKYKEETRAYFDGLSVVRNKSVEKNDLVICDLGDLGTTALRKIVVVC